MLSGLYLIVDQLFCAQISTDHLTAISLISYLFALFEMVGLVLAQSVMLLIGKETEQQAKNKIVGGAFLASLIASILLAAICIGAKDIYSQLFGIAHIAGVSKGLIVYTFVGALFLPNLLMKFTFISADNPKRAIYGGLIGNAINAIGCLGAVWYFKKTGNQFVGITMATLMSQVVLFFYYIYHCSAIHFKFELLKIFIVRAKDLIKSEILSSLVFTLEPVLYSLIFAKAMDATSVAAYNVGLSFSSLLFSPIQAITISGVTLLASAWEKRGARDWDKRIRMVLLLSIFTSAVPSLLAVVSIPLWLPWGFGLESWTSFVVVATMILVVPAAALVAHAECFIRTLEKNRVLSFNHFVTTFLVGLPLSLYLIETESVIVTVTCGILIPVALREIFTQWYSSRLVTLRRMTRRVKLPADLEAKFNISFISSRALNIECKLVDIGPKGCGVIITHQILDYFSVNDLVAGTINIEDSKPMYVKGVIVHRSALSIMPNLPEGVHRSFKVGIQFTQVERESVEQVALRFLEQATEKQEAA